MKTSISVWIRSTVWIALACLPGYAIGQQPPPSEQIVRALPATPAAQRPSIIFVTDFHLDASQIKHKGLLGGERQGLLGGRRPLQHNSDPADKATSLAHMLSNTIVTGLRKAGFRSEYLQEIHTVYYPGQSDSRIQFAASNAPLPREGWLLTGWFEEIQEGQSAVKATVGFGAGAGKAEADIAVSDLARDPSLPIMVMGSGNRAKKMPGGLIMMNPYVMAAKFVIDKRHGTEKDVKSLGAEIVKGVVAYINQGSVKPQ
ncbi:MAG: DUF4410 domain-containing protein [Verrucomicrobiia bacterium]